MGQLWKAVLANNLAACQKALKGGLFSRPEDVNQVDTKGLTPLHLSAYSGNVDIARVLLAAGAKVGAVSLAGQTPLHLACMQKNPTTAEFLLEAGASATIVDSGGNTPLHAYLMPGVGVSTGGLSTALLTRLLSSGASINQVNAEGDTPLLLAVKNGFSGSAISTLIDAGADPALPDRHGKLAWQYAFNRSPAIEKVFREKLMRGLA